MAKNIEKNLKVLMKGGLVLGLTSIIGGEVSNNDLIRGFGYGFLSADILTYMFYKVGKYENKYKKFK